MGFGSAPVTPTTCNFVATTIRDYFDFPSDVEDNIEIDGAATDLDFPSVVVSGLPSGATITRVIAMLKYGSRKDSSTAENYIDQASKTLRIKKSSGSWGSNDIIAIDFDQYQLRTAKSTKEGGDLIIGDNDVKTVVDGDATYNFRSEQTNRADAISALADHLILYDVQMIIRIHYTK